MKRNFAAALALISLCVVMLSATINASMAERSNLKDASSTNPVTAPKPAASNKTQPVLQQGLPTDCAIQPEQQPARSSRVKRPEIPDSSMTLERFRRTQIADASSFNQSSISTRVDPGYVPYEQIIPIDPTNYGDRYLKDINGNPANLDPIIVLHETVGSAASTVGYFRTPHFRDADQVSYHTLIMLDGTIIYLVPPDKRAYGAGNSVFRGNRGVETVKTHAKFPPSVNNFAYHISLETPPDGYNNSPRHSGYTAEQYQSLAWLIAKTGVADDRITTHQAVDRSSSRMDPRSFNGSYFFRVLQTYTKTNEIPLRCTVPPGVTLSKRPQAIRSARKATN